MAHQPRRLSHHPPAGAPRRPPRHSGGRCGGERRPPRPRRGRRRRGRVSPRPRGVPEGPGLGAPPGAPAQRHAHDAAPGAAPLVPEWGRAAARGARGGRAVGAHAAHLARREPQRPHRGAAHVPAAAAAAPRGPPRPGRLRQGAAAVQEDPHVQRHELVGPPGGHGAVPEAEVPRGHVRADGEPLRAVVRRRHPVQGPLRDAPAQARPPPGVDHVHAGVPAAHAELRQQERVQLDGHVPPRLRHRGALREVGVLRPQHPPEDAGDQLRGQQDQAGGLVRVQLRRAQQPPAVRQGAGPVHRGRHLRGVRGQEVPPLQLRQVLRDAEQGLQVLPRLRELQLPRLHHREVLRQRPQPPHPTYSDGSSPGRLREAGT